MPMQSVAGRKTFRPGQPTARNTLPRGGIIHGVPAVVDNAIKPPPAPSAPGVPPIKPAYQGDAQYFTQLAQKRFDATQQEQGLDQQSAYDRTDLTEALRRRAEQHPKDAQATNESYNRSGLLFSGKLSEARSLQEQQYLREQADQQGAFDRREQSRIAARAAIESGFPLEQAALFAQSVDRQQQRDQQDALNNMLPTGTPATKPKTFTGGTPTAKNLPGKTYKPTKRKTVRNV
jgi:hypothetical protein